MIVKVILNSMILVNLNYPVSDNSDSDSDSDSGSYTLKPVQVLSEYIKTS